MSSIEEKHEELSKSSSLLGIVLIIASLIGFMMFLRATFQLITSEHYMFDYHLIMVVLFLVPSAMLFLPGLMLIRFQKQRNYLGFKKIKTGYIFLLVSVAIVGIISFLLGGFFLLEHFKRY